MTAPGPVAESDALLESWRCVVARHGERIALSNGRRTLTYRQLAAVAQRIGGRLAAAGAAPGRQVMLQVNAPIDAVMSMLGVLEAGAAFALLEDGLPQAARAARMDRVSAVLSAGRGQPADALPLPWVDLAPELDGVEPDGPVPAGGICPGPAAYVMFTSGSTGRPKAVEIGRDALHGFSLAAADRLALRPGDRWLQLASLGFDVLIEEVFPALMTGSTVVCRPDSVAPDPQELHAMLSDMGVTIVELSTQYWREYARWLDVRNETTPPGLRRVLVGGERMDPDDWRRWERSGHAPLVHVYGLTECTVTSTMYDGRLPADAQEVPIGTPLANAEVTVRGADRLPVTPGELGEICIGGPSLASGYIGDPEQTARRFVPDPRSPERHLYVTGDRGRILPDGNLEFRGRLDDQLKVRGHRLEPASVERLLTADPGVAQAVVLLDVNTRTTLSACLVPAGPVPGVTGDRVLPVTGERREELLAVLGAELPDWAVPRRLFWTAELPKNAHGKLDRHSLDTMLAAASRPTAEATAPAADADTSRERGQEPGEGPAQLAAVLERFRVLLGDPGFGPDSDFFEGGGQSILAMRLVTELRATLPSTPGLRTSTVFDHPTPRRLAHWVAARTGRSRNAPER
ncbi:amino acid adenylation domain-containing protein [Streptomyces sp. B3I8]|uniref:amino acid adenylation domain-containing protein n=1 Tax=Streptomyces sp. B3I8 TaxID=3042303 RepID=UPI00277FF296|nr:amino acid adenylation domain-containing protein [Streptomyces sp. B3I8]MDQ0785207.1 amino acid adenylation domain-containing protein [Streptomyces sp. B3I8]